MENIPEHIAIIMDGNRRWAKREGLDTPSGHKEGAENLKRIAKFANDIGVKYMTVYAFSTENWKRSETEISALMKLLKYYAVELITKGTEGIKLKVIGNRENINKDIKEVIEKLEEKTKDNTGMTLNIAFNYGGRDEIVNTTKKIVKDAIDNKISVDSINEELFSNYIYTAGQPDPDLLIRTSGEERLSNFLLWQLAYSEFYFSEKFWPEFNNDDLLEAIKVFQNRTRKFGGK